MATEKYTKVNQDVLRGFLQISVFLFLPYLKISF